MLGAESLRRRRAAARQRAARRARERLVRRRAVCSSCSHRRPRYPRRRAPNGWQSWPRRRTRFIFVTGGVVSSLGKGIAAASIGQLLVARGLSVSLQKFDPYINVDPGTMSPFQHGEVFVTEDGAETDLDLGHYERFTDVNAIARVQRHHRRDLRLGHPARAPRRLPRRHRPGDPAHHRRDQEPHPARGRRPTTWTS